MNKKQREIFINIYKKILNKGCDIRLDSRSKRGYCCYISVSWRIGTVVRNRYRLGRRIQRLGLGLDE
jgi:hypothetical protein